MGKQLHLDDHRIDWSNHADALVVGPALEQKVTHIREALLDVNRGKLTWFACLQVIAVEVFTQAEIAEYAAEGKCPECGFAHAPGDNTCCSR